MEGNPVRVKRVQFQIKKIEILKVAMLICSSPEMYEVVILLHQ